MAHITVAYEPVWAIGTGKTATPEDAQKAHAAIRSTLAFQYDQNHCRQPCAFQYGGSMKPANAGDLLSQTDIDGGLIGGAALKADDFAGNCQSLVLKLLFSTTPLSRRIHRDS